MRDMFRSVKLRTKIIIVIAILAAILVPVIMRDNRYYMNIFINLAIYVILGSSMNLLIGYSGQISLGTAGFYGIGAYTSVLLVMNCGVPFPIALIAAVVLCFLVGFVLGFPATKLNFIFLGLSTAGINTIIYLIINNSQFTGGASGITGIRQVQWFGENMNKLQYYLMTLAFVLVVLFICFRLVNSKTGRALKAIKGNQIAAAAMGINVNRYKLLIFAITSAMCGLAGVLYAFNIRYIQAEAFTVNNMSFKILTMGIIGGMGDLGGGVIGSLIAGLLPELLRNFSRYELTIYGALIVIILRFMPRGIVYPIQLGLDKLELLFRKKQKEPAGTGKEV
ncbi:MAG: branched-chain amino acid ABC transporter permease [Parasporobacterium sp.]|nr:branched-chain amino acid ABC transporter permease [Parasporobacterium sp.]